MRSEHMTSSKKFVLHLSGASCTGKSALAQELGNRLPGVYLVAYDKLKWQLAGYHRELRHRIFPLVLGFFEVVCRNGLPILLSTIIRDQKEYSSYADIGEKYGYTFLSVSLTAPTDVLLVRFRERVQKAKAAHTNISVTDEAFFLENTQKNNFFVPDGTPSFDSSVMTTKEIADAVVRLLKQRNIVTP